MAQSLPPLIGKTYPAKLLSILEEIQCPAKTVFAPDRPRAGLKKYTFQADDLGLIQGDGFGENCFYYISAQIEAKLRKGEVSFKVRRMGPAQKADNVHLFVDDFSGTLSVLVGSSGNLILGQLGQINLDVRLGHGGMLVVGDQTTINGARVVAVNGTIIVKRDVMFSDEILVQGSDQHGIIDLKTGGFINLERNFVTIEAHVWVGRRATIMPGVRLGAGSIIGACSVVTADVAPMSVAAGAPARCLRENVSWARPWNQIDAETQQFFQDNDVEFLRRESSEKPQK